jgi:hypothetical protein
MAYVADMGNARGARESDGWVAFAVGLALLLVGAWLCLTPKAMLPLAGRDLPAYQSAINAFAAGRDPYLIASMHNGHSLPFIGPPFVWELYKLAAHRGLSPIFSSLLLAADVISVMAIPAILSRLLLGPGLGRTMLGAGFFFAAFGGSGIFTALVINNGTPLYALIALGMVPAVTGGRWWAFHLAVALATAFKPFYAAFWIVPLLAESGRTRQWAPTLIAFTAAAMTYVVPMLRAPKLMSEWTHSLLRTVGARQVGDNLFGAITSEPLARHEPWAPYAAHAVFSALLLGACLRLGKLHRTHRIAALTLVAVFLNPRAMRYDLSTAAVPLLALAAGVTSRGPSSATAQAASAIVLAGLMAALSRNQTTDGFLYAAIALVALLGTAIGSRAAGSPAAR